MKVYKLEDLVALGCGKSSQKYLSNILESCLEEDWKGTLLDILNNKRISPHVSMRIVLSELRNEFILTEGKLRLFSVWCARKAIDISLSGSENTICSNICDVAERYACNKASVDELISAKVEAMSIAAKTKSNAACKAANSVACSAYYYVFSGKISDANNSAYGAAWYAAASESSMWYETRVKAGQSTNKNETNWARDKIYYGVWKIQLEKLKEFFI